MALSHHRTLIDPGWQRLVFTLATLIALVLIGLNGLLVVQSELFDGILNTRTVAAAAAHFNTLEHRVHDLSFGLLYATGAAGLLTQLRNPRRNVAGLFMALSPWAALGLVFLLSDYWVPFGTQFQMYATAVFGGLTLSAVLLHPAGRDLFTTLRRTDLSRSMLAMAGGGGVPALIYAVTNVGLQRSEGPGNIHWQLGHYGFIAAISFTMVGLAVLAGLRPPGWRLAAWPAGMIPALLGVVSLLNPGVDSSFSGPWAWLAIAWGIGFITLAERTHRGDTTPLVGRRSKAEAAHELGG